MPYNAIVYVYIERWIGLVVKKKAERRRAFVLCAAVCSSHLSKGKATSSSNSSSDGYGGFWLCVKRNETTTKIAATTTTTTMTVPMKALHKRRRTLRFPDKQGDSLVCEFNQNGSVIFVFRINSGVTDIMYAVYAHFWIKQKKGFVNFGEFGAFVLADPDHYFVYD